MNKETGKYHLINEMFETIDVIRSFSSASLFDTIKTITKSKRLVLTGEGSSRIFPAKNAISYSMINNIDINIITEGSRQVSEYNTDEYVIFGASNSGRTKEVIDLFESQNSLAKYSLTAHTDTQLESLSDLGFILNCGGEEAVAATKSVVEQALFYQNLLAEYNGGSILSDMDELADKCSEVLHLDIDKQLIEKIGNSNIIYFSGRNNGVAEEATLKTNEITHKNADYLEGTYAVHGIEEVMTSDDVIILINPYLEEEQKIQETLVDNIGLTVIAISSRNTIFPTINIPSMDNFDTYLEFMACWNIMVEVGLYLGINLDKPERARKVGNEA